MNDKQSRRFAGAVILPAVLAVVTVAYLIEAMLTLRPIQEGTAGPSFFPIVISAVMLIALAAVVRREWRKAAEGRPAPWTALGAPLKVVVVTAVYIAAFQPLGYFISTALYVLALLLVFRFKGRGAWVSVVWAVVISGACWLLFAQVFQIRLPRLEGFI